MLTRGCNGPYTSLRIESLGNPVGDERMARSADLQAQRTSKFRGFRGVVEVPLVPCHVRWW